MAVTSLGRWRGASLCRALAHFQHGIATIATLLMTLFIQRSEHRDTQAIHAKLDELLRADGEARNQLTHLDEKEPEQVEAFRSKAKGDRLAR